MIALDLQLQQQQNGDQLNAFVVSPSGQEAFLADVPLQAIEWQQEWRRQFLAHHDPAGTAVSADAVRRYAAGLSRAMSDWLAQPTCLPLQQALQDHPGLPLRLRLEGSELARSLEHLPWELLTPDRPLWRVIRGQRRPDGNQPRRARRPRLLVVAGAGNGLQLGGELERLDALRRQGRLELRLLSGPGCSISALRQQLLDPNGWDALIFLGHSNADPSGGGQLQLGDGSWVAAAMVEAELQTAAGHGLALALFNSCSGLDLARSSVSAGVDWALCFREPVPGEAASRAFTAMLSALEAGNDLFEASRQARLALSAAGDCVGSDLLLSLVAATNARPFLLPLRKRKQLLLRLARSSRRQALVAGACVALGAIADLDPANPISAYLLDRRLYAQRLWRQTTKQPGPTAPALPVVVIDPHDAMALGAEPTPGRVSRDLLARLLKRIPPDQVPKVGLDFVLDEPQPFTAELAAVIQQQARPLLFAGFYGAQVQATAAGQSSMPLPLLRQAGLKARDLSVGTPARSDRLKGLPLQLWDPLDRDSFAAALSSATNPSMPSEAVIDWSIDWRPLLRRVDLADLAALRAPSLVIGSDGNLDRDGADLFTAPGSMDPALTAIWQGASREVPGVVIQAVLAQSISLRHWLTPVSQTFSTALAAGLGVLLAAGSPRWGRRVLWIALIIGIAIPLGWQLAVSLLCLLPLVLPLAALTATALLRHE